MATKTKNRKRQLSDLNIDELEHRKYQLSLVSKMESLADALLTSCEDDHDFGSAYPERILKELAAFKRGNLWISDFYKKHNVDGK